ncbi:MAG: polyphosphate kinase 1, partial [Bacteroidota bacterium]
NFHEDTAKVYSDLGILTTDTRLTNEVARVFSYLETVKVPANEFHHLLVGQFNLRRQLVAKIDREIAHAQAGRSASMILKMNSLQDEEMIRKLYEASNAGVEIKLIIRGICCLVAGVEGYSENIEAFSIVDRFLEHARIFIFHNDGDEEIYLSSADWMVRNLSHRIEVTFPIYDEKLKYHIKHFMHIQIHDNVKARVLGEKMRNEYRQTAADLSVRSQMETYFYLKRREEEYRQAIQEASEQDVEGFRN